MNDDRDAGRSFWESTRLHPLAGGYSGETFVAGEGADRVVVRIYARKPDRAAIDASLLHLVRGLIPVPRVLELRHATARAPAVLVTEYVDGIRLDTALADPGSGHDLEVLGAGVGALLSTLSGMPFLDVGQFADARLALSAAPLPSDLRDWAERLRIESRLAGWQHDDWAALLRLVDQAEDLVEDDARRHGTRAVLAHSDLNPKNILVDPNTSELVALLDWEFAHAGSRYTDLGNFCRFERDPRLVEPLLATVAASAGGGPDSLRLLGRALDLWALLELVGRSHPGPVQDLATALLLEQARTGDLDAWPWRTSRVDPRPATAP